MTPARSIAALVTGAIVIAMTPAQAQWGEGGPLQVSAPDSSDIEVEGRLTGELSVPGRLRLAFETGGGRAGFHRWTTPLYADGSYRVTLPAIERDDQICIRAEPSGLNGHEPADPVGGVLVKCAHFASGLQRLDIEDVHLPRGIVRIEVAPVEDAGVGDSADLTVSIAGTAGPSTLRAFPLNQGLRAEFFSDYREREFTVSSRDRLTILASSRVTLSSERPVRVVTLTVAPTR